MPNMDSSNISPIGDLQQTLMAMMTELQGIKENGETDDSPPKYYRVETNPLSGNHILQRVQRLENKVITLTGNHSGKIARQGSSTCSRLYFPALPAEVRLMIYDHAFPQRILMFHPEGPWSRPYLSMKPLPPPAIALTCREAYHFSREQYRQLSFAAVYLKRDFYEDESYHEQHDEMPRFRTWFNPDRDVLLLDLEQAYNGNIRNRTILTPSTYNPSRDLPGPGSNFSQFVRGIWSFTTIAKHVLLRSALDHHHRTFYIYGLFIYGFSDAFPLLQEISLVTYLYQWPHTSQKVNEFLLEDSALLVDVNNKFQTDQVTSMLLADILLDSALGYIEWNSYLEELRNQQSQFGPLVQRGWGQHQKILLDELQKDLARSQLYADTAYSMNTEGDRVYDALWSWTSSSDTAHESEVAARLKQLPIIKAACLVLKPAWTIRLMASDPQKPLDVEPHWVPQ